MAERQFFVITEIPDSVYYDATRGGGRQFNESRTRNYCVCVCFLRCKRVARIVMKLFANKSFIQNNAIVITTTKSKRVQLWSCGV